MIKLNTRPNIGAGGREPVFFLPGFIIGLTGLMVTIHLARTLALSEESAFDLVVWFGFIPTRIIAAADVPGGLSPLVWSPFTHALLHGSWEHLFINTAWLVVFGTPVARRYGALKTFVLFAISAAAGAVFFAALTLPGIAILVGASGGISGLTGAAVRFVFQPVETARHPQTGEMIILGRRLAGLGEMMRERRARAFVIVWVALNLAVPALPLVLGGGIGGIAWQAHLGGFFAGLLLVPLFERRARSPRRDPGA